MLYNYVAIIAKTTVVDGKVTHIDKRKVGDVPLDSQAVTGQVLAGGDDLAKRAAIAELKRQYPEEQGYKNHDNVQVWIG
jgi:hypothetical protein